MKKINFKKIVDKMDELGFKLDSIYRGSYEFNWKGNDEELSIYYTMYDDACVFEEIKLCNDFLLGNIDSGYERIKNARELILNVRNEFGVEKGKFTNGEYFINEERKDVFTLSR